MNARIMEFKILGERNAPLVALESNKNIPFHIERVYYLFGTEKGVKRGFHAHRKLQQIMICVSGSCTVLLEDGKKKLRVVLDRPSVGLYLSGMIWREIHDLSDDCVILVLADQHYDENDYVRSYEEFLSIVSRNL